MIYALVIFNVFAASCCQMLLKNAARKSYDSWWRQYVNPWVISGYVILGLTMVLNIYALSQGIQVKELSIIEALSYLFVPTLSYLCFREKITRMKLFSIAIILFGFWIFFS